MDQGVSKNGDVSLSPLVRLYYQLKRFIPKRMRLGMRKAHVSRILASRPVDWPISEAAGRRPEDWPGWPDGQQFAFVLTHDVEDQRGLDRVKEIAELEMELGYRSVFNFIPEGPYQVPESLRSWLVERGFEIGVHDLHHDGNLYSCKASFKQKAARVNDYLREWNAVGFRSGFMLHNLEWAQELDVLWEASTFDTDPFEPQPDGVHTIFPFWVHKKEAGGSEGLNGATHRGYVELPYTLPQDSTVFIHLGQRTIDLWKLKLDWIAEKGGMAMLILHPDYASPDASNLQRDEFPLELYREFLEYVRGRHGDSFWHTLPREVAAYCKRVWTDFSAKHCISLSGLWTYMSEFCVLV